MTRSTRLFRLGSIVCLAFGFTFHAAALSPAGQGAVEFQQKWRRSMNNFALGEVGTFPSGKLTIQYRIFTREEARRNVVIFPGYGEAPQKYAELITDFQDRGYNVFILSHRGMGESTRVLKNPQIVHAESFVHYYDDADYFLRSVVGPRTKGQPVFLFAHSFGGLVGAHALASNPDFFDKAVLNGPLFEPNLHGYWRWTAWLYGLTLPKEDYAPGYGDWDPTKATFETQTATASRLRWGAVNQMYRAAPGLAAGGPSTAWVLAMLEQTAPGEIAALAKQVKTPVLLFQAGDDTYVEPSGHDAFVKNAKGAKLKRFPTARHEIHQEREFIRHEATDALFWFFER